MHSVIHIMQYSLSGFNKAVCPDVCLTSSAGNLGRVDLISEYEYDLFIRPDTCNPRFRLWFNFIVDNIRIDQVSQRMLLYFKC